MKRKHLIKGLLLTLGFLCTMGLGMANTETTITHYPDSNVEYTLNKGRPTQQTFTAGTITISDGTTTITMLDRNLGATAAGTGCEDPSGGTACMNGTPDETYGYHFQRGNNYGFAPNFSGNDNFPGGESKQEYNIANIDGSAYGPSEYSGNIFITDETWSNNGDWSIIKNDNLRGGTGDTESNSFPVTNATERQGPCPEGFHVPSAGEWDEVLNMLDQDFSKVHGGEGTLMIPFACGRYYYNAIAGLFGNYAYLRSSSPIDTDARYLYLAVSQYLGMSNNSRANGFSVRCFKDPELVTVSFYADGKLIEEKKVLSGTTVGSSGSPYKKGYITEGWYSNLNFSGEPFDFENTVITGDITLYAKYQPFQREDITICDPENTGACITMMDRNLGAARAGEGCRRENDIYCYAGWAANGYDTYSSCYEDYMKPLWQYLGYSSQEECISLGYEPEPYCEISYGIWAGGGSVEDFCGLEEFEGFDSYEQCKSERDRVEAEYNECIENNKGIYGYHFQWGNNYGFDLVNLSLTTTYINRDIDSLTSDDMAKWDLSYDNYGYMKNMLFHITDYWENNEHYDGLRGGSGDNKDNNRGYDTGTNTATNVSGRQGPCPDGYHVPSAGERNAVLDYYISENGHKEWEYVDENGLIQGYCASGFSYHCYKEVFDEYCVEWDIDGNCVEFEEYSYDEEVDCEELVYSKKKLECDGLSDKLLVNFYSHFKFPYAGVLDWTEGGDWFGGVNQVNSIWSSSPKFNSNEAYGIDYQIMSFYRSYGKSVRCFKNIPNTMQQDEGGEENQGGETGNTGNGGNTGGNVGHSGGGGGGGGGSSLKKDICPNGDYSDSYYDGKCGTNTKDSSAEPQNDGKQVQDYSTTTQNDKSGHNSADELVYDTLRFNPHYSDEMNKAYQFAYHYGITTKDSISSADMNGNLTRIAMAKMLSQYAINILGMKPDTTRQKTFSDVSTTLDSKYDNGVTLAYQLGIMGINMGNNFRPYDNVTRAEFATALSRLLYHTPDGDEKYYTTHMAKLQYEGIITNTNPTMKELRGYVMLMLMRSAK